MAVNRSVLLNHELPSALASGLAAEGIDPSGFWLCAETDLNLSGTYEPVYLAANAERIVTVAPARGGHASLVRHAIEKNSVAEIRTRQGIGGGFVEALVDGVYVEILAYSNARADTFHKAARKLEDWRKGKRVYVGPEDDEDPRKCPTCGMTLEFKGDICRRCINQGAVASRVLQLMRPYSGFAAIMLAVLMIIIALQMVPARLIGMLVDNVVSVKAGSGQALKLPLPLWDTISRAVLMANPRLDVHVLGLLFLVGVLFLTQLVTGAMNMVNGRLVSRVGTQITSDLRKQLFRRLNELSVDYYDRHNVGTLVSRVSYDTEAMKDFVRQAIQGLLAQMVVLVVTGVMLFSISWKLALWTLLPAPIVVFASTFYWRRIYPRYYRVWEGWSRMNGSLSSILSGMRVVKAFGQESREEERYAKTGDYVRDSTRGVEYTTSVFNPVMGLIFGMGGLIVWVVGGRSVIEGQGLSLGSLMAFLNYLAMFYAPMTNLSQLTDWVTRFLTAAQRVFEIMDTSPQITPSSRPRRLADPKGHIVFDHVTFGYNRHEPVIKDISFEIQPGEHLGIVGKSGSGKTTLVNLLARFYDVEEGRILVDGIDVREIDPNDLRRTIGIVLQESFLFRGTIHANITYGNLDAQPETVLSAAKAANAHDFIIRHPLGYDTYIGERGAGLSGGERQRASIARALLYDPKVLILDEATSNVDTESEQLIQEALSRFTKGRTSIAIAHRLSTLKTSDRIIVMEYGQIIEMGTHEELLALGGLYHKLVKIQTELSREPSVDSLTVKKEMAKK
ncbi:MAG: ABC transporter ATP-binding protein [Spirochaetia bacterium]|jgi:ATP-binding cassette subfamily B protein